ncbi:hypothetical protein [Haladaptatus sp. CMAA 1909]
MGSMGEKCCEYNEVSEKELYREYESVLETWVGVSIDAVFTTLANQHRRSILYVLDDHVQPMSQSELLNVLANLKYGTTVDEIAPTDTERLSASLHHLHLPRLKDARLIEYDPSAETVSLTKAGKSFSRILDQFINTALLD